MINLNEADVCTVIHARPNGCLKKLLGILDSKTLVLAGVVLGVAGIQVNQPQFFFCFIITSFKSETKLSNGRYTQCLSPYYIIIFQILCNMFVLHICV